MNLGEVGGMNGSFTLTLNDNMDDVPTVLGNERLQNAGAAYSKDFKSTLHNHRLWNANCEDLVFIRIVVIHEDINSEVYPYW